MFLLVGTLPQDGGTDARLLNASQIEEITVAGDHVTVRFASQRVAEFAGVVLADWPLTQDPSPDAEQVQVVTAFDPPA